jgi:uncharacterized membrane protein YfcA
MSSAHIVQAIVFTVVFLVVAFYLYLRQRRKREVLQARVDLQTRVLDRFDSPQEFTAFLNTEGGRHFLDGLADEQGWGPARRILFAVQTGIVMVFFGLGLGTIWWLERDEDIIYGAMIFLFLGLGFLVSAIVSHRLSRAWDLMPEGAHERAARLAAEVEGGA